MNKASSTHVSLLLYFSHNHSPLPLVTSHFLPSAASSQAAAKVVDTQCNLTVSVGPSAWIHTISTLSSYKKVTHLFSGSKWYYRQHRRTGFGVHQSNIRRQDIRNCKSYHFWLGVHRLALGPCPNMQATVPVTAIKRLYVLP